MVEELFGIDVSRYQGVIDWGVIKAHVPTVRFVGIRATISWGYVDPFFGSNWKQARGIARTAYHVVYPKESVQKQCDNLLLAVGSDLGELPLTLDVELDHSASPAQIQDTVWRSCLYIEARAGKMPLMYSRKQWLEQFLIGPGKTTPAWLNELYHWLALYLMSGAEHPGPALPPKGVDAGRVLIHQTSGSATPFGVESKELDYNRWQGPEALFLEMTGGEPTEQDQLAILWREAAAHGWNLK